MMVPPTVAEGSRFLVKYTTKSDDLIVAVSPALELERSGKLVKILVTRVSGGPFVLDPGNATVPRSRLAGLGPRHYVAPEGPPGRYQLCGTTWVGRGEKTKITRVCDSFELTA